MNQLNYGNGSVVPMPHPSVPLGYGGSIASYGNPMAMPASGVGLSTGNPVAAIPQAVTKTASKAATPVLPVGGPVMNAPQIAAATAASSNGGKTDPKTDPSKPGFFGADGFTLGDVKGIVDIIGGFGSLWSGIQMNKLAKDTLNFQKDAYNRNLTNSIASYNLALEDRMNARYAQNNRSPAEAQEAIDRHKLKR